MGARQWAAIATAVIIVTGGSGATLGQALDQSELRGENIRLRTEPADGARELAVLQGGEEIDITGAAVLVDRQAWYPIVVVATAEEGWVRWEFVVGGSPVAEPAALVDLEPTAEPRTRRAATEVPTEVPEDTNSGRNRQQRNRDQGDQAVADVTPTKEPRATRVPKEQRQPDNTAEPEATVEATLPPEPVATPEPTPAAAADTPAASDSGTEANPIPFGSTGTVGDWEIRITQFRRNATDPVLEASDANEDPKRGEQYALVEVNLTATGDRPGDPSDLLFATIGDAGTAYEAGGCAEAPDALDLDTRIPAGDQVAGNLCFAIAEEDAASLRLYVNDPLDVAEDAVWFGLRS